MAITIEAAYSKKLGLPGYSSHSYSVMIRTEFTLSGQPKEITPSGSIQSFRTRQFNLFRCARCRSISRESFWSRVSGDRCAGA